MTSFMPLTRYKLMVTIHYRHGDLYFHAGNAMTTKTVLSLFST